MSVIPPTRSLSLAASPSRGEMKGGCSTFSYLPLERGGRRVAPGGGDPLTPEDWS